MWFSWVLGLHSCAAALVWARAPLSRERPPLPTGGEPSCCAIIHQGNLIGAACLDHRQPTAAAEALEAALGPVGIYPPAAGCTLAFNVPVDRLAASAIFGATHWDELGLDGQPAPRTQRAATEWVCGAC